MSLRAALLVLPLSAVPACSLFVKSDDLLGGSGATDAGAAASVDGAALADGGVSPGACTGKTVCDDFEGAGNIPWSAQLGAQDGNATIVVDGVNPHGGTKSLHAVRPQASGRGSAVWGFHLPSSLRFCEFDVYATASSTDNTVAAKLAFEQPTTPYDGYFLNFEMGGGVEQFGSRSGSTPYDTSQFVRELAYGKWLHVRFEVDRSSASPHVALNVDGKAIPDFPITPPASALGFLQFGIAYQAVAGMASEVFFDNIACTRE